MTLLRSIPFLEIDGNEVADADLRVEQDFERGDVWIVTLIHGDEALELGRWSTKTELRGVSSKAPRVAVTTCCEVERH